MKFGTAAAILGYIVASAAEDVIGYVGPSPVTLPSLNILDNQVYVFEDVDLTVQGPTSNANKFFFVSPLGGTSSDKLNFKGDFSNTGEFVYDTILSMQPTYAMFEGQSFTNNGEMFLSFHRDWGSTAAQVYMSNVRLWTNTNLIFVEKLGLLAIEPPSGAENTAVMNNAGSLCLVETSFSQSMAITGSGCISVGAFSILTLDQSLPFDQRQTVLLADTYSAIKVPLRTGANFTIQLAGFGGSNTIILDGSYTSYNYDTNSGILSFIDSTSLANVNFRIGQGYDSSLFVFSQYANNPSVSYVGTARTTVPNVCYCNRNKPIPPPTSKHTTTVTSTWTGTFSTQTTMTDPNPYGTDTVVIEVPSSSSTSFLSLSLTSYSNISSTNTPASSTSSSAPKSTVSPTLISAVTQVSVSTTIVVITSCSDGGCTIQSSTSIIPVTICPTAPAATLVTAYSASPIPPLKATLQLLSGGQVSVVTSIAASTVTQSAASTVTQTAVSSISVMNLGARNGGSLFVLLLSFLMNI